MIRLFSAVSIVAFAVAAPAAAQQDLAAAISLDYSEHGQALYRHFHENPELSLQEFQTAARLAAELRAVGFEVTEDVGRTGVVAVLENGPGPVLALRADMDGLPVVEDTGLAFASTARQVDYRGVDQPVMHACAHDTHMTGLVMAADGGKA